MVNECSRAVFVSVVGMFPYNDSSLCVVPERRRPEEEDEELQQPVIGDIVGISGLLLLFLLLLLFYSIIINIISFCIQHQLHPRIVYFGHLSITFFHFLSRYKKYYLQYLS